MSIDKERAVLGLDEPGNKDALRASDWSLLLLERREK